MIRCDVYSKTVYSEHPWDRSKCYLYRDVDYSVTWSKGKNGNRIRVRKWEVFTIGGFTVTDFMAHYKACLTQNFAKISNTF